MAYQQPQLVVVGDACMIVRGGCPGSGESGMTFDSIPVSMVLGLDDR